jgi:CRP-like cAMP-binding protein
MLKKFLPKKQALKFAASVPPLSQSPSPLERIRAVESSPAAERAAELLSSASALMQLTPNEARVVVSYMRPKRVPEGTVFIQEGDTTTNDFMLLVLKGEVAVETTHVSRSEPQTVSVLGPGHVIGEMGLLDGGARSASCKAMSDVQGAILSREALTRLTQEDPLTAAKLLMAIAQRMAERLRESGEKLKMYAQLTQAMQQELNLHAPAQLVVKPSVRSRA